jgi:two-component system response regulator YesN
MTTLASPTRKPGAGPADRGVRKDTIDRRRALYEEARALMRAELDRDLSVQEVARRIATSPRQLQRAFSEVGGTTFRASLRELRMLEAARLLSGSTTEVRVVAKTVGYRAAGQFTRAFARVHGIQPSAFRDRIWDRRRARAQRAGTAGGPDAPSSANYVI